MKEYPNKRKYRRIRITTISSLNNTSCAVINVSKKGLLLSGDNNETVSQKKQVDIQLKIKVKWIDLKGIVVWPADGPRPKLKRIRVCITYAPPEYEEFIDNLYLEADEKEDIIINDDEIKEVI